MRNKPTWTIEGPLPVPAKYAQDIHRIASAELSADYTAYIGADFWVALAEGEVVAMASMLASAKEPEAAYLNRCVVTEPWRGKGIQGALIKARLKEASRRGFRWATSDTWWETVGSANNLLKAGFRLYRPEKPWRGLGTIYWRKDLG